MSQNPRSPRHNVSYFYDNCNEVCLDSLDDPRTSNRQFQEAVKKSNDMMTTAWQAREENSFAWIHNSLRWRLLHLTLNDYANEANMCPSAIKTLENPKTQRDLHIHQSAHVSIAYLSSLQNLVPVRIRNVLEYGRQKLLEALVEPYQLQTERLILSQRVIAGPATFDEKTGHATQRLTPRIAKERITPFNELVDIMRGLHFPNAKNMKENNPATWLDPHIAAAREAYVADQVTMDIPEPVAQIMALIEFSGHTFTTDELKLLELTQATRKALTNKRMVQADRLEPIRELCLKTVGADATEQLFESWNEEFQKVKRRTTFSKQLRTAIQQRNAEPVTLLPAFGIDPGECVGHEVVRSALERGPSKKMPLIGLVHVLATNAQELMKYERRARGDLRQRWSANRTHASFTLPAELQYCGIEVDELDFTETEKDEYAKLQRGGTSSLREKEVLQGIYDAAVEKNVMPVLKRWVASQEPTDVARMFSLLAMRKSHELRKLVQGAKTSEGTVNAIRNNELVPLHTLLKDFCEAAEVTLPAPIEIQCLVQTADALASKDAMPLGRAVNALIAHTHRHSKTFHREKEIGISSRTFHGYLQAAATNGTTNPKLVDEILAKVESKDKKALQKYLELLQGSDDETSALASWLETMINQGKTEHISGFSHLQGLLADTVEINRVVDSPHHKKEDLLERNFRLHRWKYGKMNPATGDKEDLSSPEERLALQTLLLLPGSTTESILAISLDDLQGKLRQHLDRICLLTDIPADDTRIPMIIKKLLQQDPVFLGAFYGDMYEPGSAERIGVFKLRHQLEFRELHLDADQKNICSQQSAILSDDVPAVLDVDEHVVI